MKKQKLNITVSGEANTGKSSLTYLLKNFLLEKGFNVKIKTHEDYKDDNDFENQMSKKSDDVINDILDKQEILINEVTV